MTTDYEYLVED